MQLDDVVSSLTTGPRVEEAMLGYPAMLDYSINKNLFIFFVT